MKKNYPALADINTDKKLTFTEFPAVSLEEWESVIKEDLKGADYKEKLRWKTGEGIEVLPFYRKEDLKDLTHSAAPVSRKETWEIRQRITNPDVKTANKQAVDVLKKGADSVCFDLPPESIHSEDDISSLIIDIPLQSATIHLGPAISSPVIFEWVKEVAGSANVTLSIDPFARAAASGELISHSGLSRLEKLLSLPLKTCAVNANIYGNAGATVVQQLAFALATGNEWFGLADETDISALELNKKIHFNFSIGPNYFLEIAKFRAFRLLWNQVLEVYSINPEEQVGTYIHGETASWNKARSDAHNNMLRSTTEAMSAIIGGCNAVTVDRYDDEFSEWSDFSSRVARNTQLILKEEAYFDKVADPAAGAYYVEVLTDKLAEESWKLFREIESQGGFYKCLKAGLIQEWISNSRQEKVKAYKENQRDFLGVNKYQPEGNDQTPNSKFQTSWHFAPLPEDINFEEIESISPLNLEAELTGVPES